MPRSGVYCGAADAKLMIYVQAPMIGGSQAGWVPAGVRAPWLGRRQARPPALEVTDMSGFTLVLT